MAAVMQHLNFRELDKMEEKLWAAKKSKNNEMKAEKKLLLPRMTKNEKMVI